MSYESDDFDVRVYREAEAKKVLARLQSIIDNEKENQRDMMGSVGAISSILSASGDVLGMISPQKKTSRSVAFKIKNNSQNVFIPQYVTIKDVNSVKENIDICAPGNSTQLKISYSNNGGVNSGGNIEVSFMLVNSNFEALKCQIDFQPNYDIWHPRMFAIVEPESDKIILRKFFSSDGYSLIYLRVELNNNQPLSFGLATFTSLDSEGESYLNLTITDWRKDADDVLN